MLGSMLGSDQGSVTSMRGCCKAWCHMTCTRLPLMLLPEEAPGKLCHACKAFSSHHIPHVDVRQARAGAAARGGASQATSRR